MFFKKKMAPKELSLVEIVPKVTNSGYLFWDINDDLGTAAEVIMASTPLNKMAYGYARRAAMAALFIQGVTSADHYAHASSIFKALQVQTGTSVEFQEDAARTCEIFMQTYTNQINSLFLKKVIAISLEYEIPDGRMTDADFFAAVVDTIYVEQREVRAG